MSTKIGDMAIYISANTYGLARDLTRASSLVTDFGGRTLRQMAGVGRSLASAFRDVGVVAGGDLLAGGIRAAAGGVRDLVADSVRLAAAGEVSAMKFETLTGSLEAAKETMGELRALAANSPVSTADAFRLGAGLISAGLPRDQVAPTLARLSDLTGDRQQLADLTRAYSQVFTTGRLQLDEWNQIANTGTINFKDLAKVLKADEDQVKKLIEAGRVGFHHLQMAIQGATDAGGRFYRMGEKYAGTLAGKFDKFADSWEQLKTGFGAAVAEELNLSGAADGLSNYADEMNGVVDALRPAIRFVGELGRGLAQLAAEGGRAAFEVMDVTLERLNHRFPETARWIRETVTDLKDFKIDPEGIARFAVSLSDGIGDAIQSAKPYWDAFIYDFVVPVKEVIASLLGAVRNVERVWAVARDPRDAEGLRENQRRLEAYDARIKDLAAANNITRDAAIALDAKEGDRKRLAGVAAIQEKLVLDFPASRQYEDDLKKTQAELAAVDSAIAALKNQTDPISEKTLTARLQASRAAREQAAIWKAEQGIFDAAQAPAGANFRVLTPAVESRLSDLAGKLNEKFADPLKKLQDDLADLDALKAAGRIDDRVYGRAMQDLLPGGGAGSNGPHLADAAELGSQQLANMVARASAGTQGNDVPGLLERIRVLLEEQNRIGGRIEQGVNQAPVVVTMPE